MGREHLLWSLVVLDLNPRQGFNISELHFFLCKVGFITGYC